jgi:hypothetical protein
VCCLPHRGRHRGRWEGEQINVHDFGRSKVKRMETTDLQKSLAWAVKIAKRNRAPVIFDRSACIDDCHALFHCLFLSFGGKRPVFFSGVNQPEAAVFPSSASLFMIQCVISARKLSTNRKIDVFFEAAYLLTFGRESCREMI